MNNNITVRLSLLLLGLLLLFSLAACRQETPAESEADLLWESATYREDSTVGEGEKAVLVDVEVNGKCITLTVMTNAATLGDALYELQLINHPSFFDTLNGIKADWNADTAYWAFYAGDRYMSVGVQDAPVEGGEHYRLVYTKG